MKKINHLFNFLSVFLLFVALTSCRTEKNIVPAGRTEPVQIEVKQNFDNSVHIGEIPTVAWHGVQEHTVERYRELKECGINYNFSWFPNIEVLAQAMDMANEAGVKMLIHCPELETEPEKTVSLFKDHPALAGYFLRDEPNRNDFPHWGELARRIQAVDNSHFCYVDLFPIIVSSKMLGTSTYLEYVQSYLQEIPVSFISFNIYPITAYNRRRSLRKEWYENLELISGEARKAGKPFWAFALATAHYSYPIPTLADLRLQVYSNLAYGAQGIQYFTYWTPTGGTENFHDGPIDDITQQRTAAWHTVQLMNREIKALSNVFLGASVIQVRHIAKTESGRNGRIPTGTTRFYFSQRPAEANIIKTFKISDGAKAVVSFLKNGSRCYMVIVNCNLEGGDNMSVIIEGGAGLQLIKKDGTAVNASSESSLQTVTPGDVLIYGWNN